VSKAFNNNVVKITIISEDEVKRININKLKEYHSKNLAVDVMVTNVHVERYPSRYDTFPSYLMNSPMNPN